MGKQVSILDTDLRRGEFHEVIIPKRDSNEDQAFIDQNVKGEWAHDWMHGEARSDPPEHRNQWRYLFADKEDAAKFRIFFG